MEKLLVGEATNNKRGLNQDQSFCGLFVKSDFLLFLSVSSSRLQIMCGFTNIASKGPRETAEAPTGQSVRNTRAR